MASWFQNNTNTSTLLLSGSYGTGQENNPGPGESESYGMSIWLDDLVIPIQYPGSEYDEFGYLKITAKYKQSINARGKADAASAILICYSGGTESCLMHAKWRIENGYPVASVVLLGPTFEATNENGGILQFGLPDNDGNLDDWADYIQYIDQNSNANVLVVNDGVDSATDASPSNCPSCSNILTYVNTGLIHYGRDGAGDSATNTSPAVKESVYNWVFNGAWSFP